MDERLVANRASWDDRTEIHLQSDFYDVERWLREERGPRPREIAALGDVNGLRLLHLQCHFGLDTMQWARAGAVATGLDFSPAAIAAAREIAARAGLSDRATFVSSNVYDATNALDHATFDVVYVSLGALCWLPSVDLWAAEVGALVAPGGRFYIHDVHPLAWALADDDSFVVEHTYFEEDEPFVDDSDQTYTDSRRPLVSGRSYEWNHSIGEIVTALIRHGLRIDSLVEHDWTAWPRWKWLARDDEGKWCMPAGRVRTPLTFTVLASRDR